MDRFSDRGPTPLTSTSKKHLQTQVLFATETARSGFEFFVILLDKFKDL